jgi:hypothetical protein
VAESSGDVIFGLERPLVDVSFTCETRNIKPLTPNLLKTTNKSPVFSQLYELKDTNGVTLFQPQKFVGLN